jgi:hypothetical protein
LLTGLEVPGTAQAKIGMIDQWLNVLFTIPGAQTCPAGHVRCWKMSKMGFWNAQSKVRWIEPDG